MLNLGCRTIAASPWSGQAGAWGVAPQIGQDGSKTLPRRFQIPLVCHHFLMFFSMGFFKIVDANLAPTCLLKSTKIHEKSMPRAIPILRLFFDRFSIDFCSMSSKPHFLIKIYGFYNIFLLFSLFKIWSIYGCIFYATWLVFWFQKINEKTKNTDSKRHRKIVRLWDRFFIDFRCVLEAKLDLCWPPFSAFERTRSLQDASKTVQDGSPDALDCPRWLQTCPRAYQTLIFGRFVVDVGRILIVFDRFVGRFWVHF